MRPAILAAVLTVACVTPIDGLLLSDLPSEAYVESVPFYDQRQNDCGAASLAMVLNWSGVRIEPEELLDEVYTASLSGALPIDLIGASRRYDRVPYSIEDLDALLREVAAGHPVLVLQNLAFAWTPVWHYAVVVGYDLDASHLVLHTGTRNARAIPLRTFMRTWLRADRWAQVVLPPQTFPVSVEEREAIRAGVALEQAGRFGDSERLYSAATVRWPESLPAQIGLGNVRYARGNLPGAEAAFRQAIALHPDAAPAHNNLAQVLLERGDLEGARIAADRAVALGGPLLPAYEETRQAIGSTQTPEPKVEGGARP